MKSLGYSKRLAVATGALLVASLALPVAPAFADHDPRHTQIQAREAHCEETLGGTFTAGAQQNQDRCVVVNETSITGIYGAPTTTFSEPRPDGTSPFWVDGPTLPAGDAQTETEIRPVGDPVVVPTTRVGAPEVERSDRDFGDPIVVPIVVLGEPSSETHTEEGTPTSTQVPGTRNCEPANQEGKDKGKSKGSPPVEKCERTVVTTTTTPTERVTTVTTPQERVTTTTQPRETVITTRTPSTEVFTSTQAQQSCLITTQPTEFVRTTVQQMEQTRTVTYNQRTITTTVTTTYRFQNNSNTVVTLVMFQNAPNPRTQIRTVEAEPIVVSETTVAAPQVETPETMAGDPIVTTLCVPTEPDIDVSEGETTYEEVVTYAPTDADISVQREQLEPQVIVTRVPGDPIVETTVQGTGETCTNNPSNSQQRRNRC